MLIRGNKAVYRDVYWQHLVYRDAGLEQLLQLLQRIPRQRTDLLRDGWRKIAEGDKTRNQALVWEGNTLLLQYEQLITLQPVYDAYPGLSRKLSYITISPLPFHFAPFRRQYPDGNIGHFATRWKWIVEHLLPEWKRLDAGSMLSEVRLIAMGKFPKSVVCFGN